MAEVAMTEEKNADERPVVLKVDHVAKMFRLPTEQATGLKMAFLNWTKGIKGYTEQHVLRDINFEVHQGDFFGIVGRNGSGKSTLLKIISQIYTPEHGSVTVKGKLVPFIELGVGFNPELTGRENVYLNGALLGFTRAEIDAMYDDIVVRRARGLHGPEAQELFLRHAGASRLLRGHQGAGRHSGA